MKLVDCVAVITGGASGLGAGAAGRLCAAGSRVVLVDRPSSSGEVMAEKLGEGAHFYACDVTDSARVQACIDWTVENLGKVNVCVNAAGIADSTRLVSAEGQPFPLDVYRRVIDVNLVGLFDVMRQAAREMTSNEPGPDGERGVIINVASIVAYEGMVGQIAYAASKGGVVSMTLPAARELAPWGIRVVTICPGVFDTGMFAGLGEKARGRLEALSVFPKRLGDPDEFGMLVESIVANPMLNGESIRLDAAARA